MRNVLVALLAVTASAQVFESRRAPADVALTADPESEFWRAATPGITLTADFYGKTVPGHATEVRSRWTPDYLYLLYVCPYDELNLKPNPTTSAETDQLWNWDVAEVFLGSDFKDIQRYGEFQVSPQGEWVDLDIDRSPAKRGAGVSWNSGFQVRARVDSNRKIWYGAMRIPMSSILSQPKATEGTRVRAGVYRIGGREPERKYLTWRPTNAKSFHVPESFGTLLLTK